MNRLYKFGGRSLAIWCFGFRVASLAAYFNVVVCCGLIVSFGCFWLRVVGGNLLLEPMKYFVDIHILLRCIAYRGEDWCGNL